MAIDTTAAMQETRATAKIMVRTFSTEAGRNRITAPKVAAKTAAQGEAFTMGLDFLSPVKNLSS